MNKIILFELNEVPIRIIKYFCKMRPNSWLAKNYANLKKFESYSENNGHLSPWNTWPTLHRGVTNEEHFISDFNQDLTDVDAAFPPIWKILAKNKIKTGVFGSLHSYPLPLAKDGYSFYIPDVFAAGSECYPENVELFQDINLKLSRVSSRNVDSSIPYKEMFSLFGHLGSLGFRAKTIIDVATHLVKERMTKWKAIRRRTYQTVVSFDIYLKLLKKEKPDFTTFFTNHVASSQHRYWAAVFPEEYEDLKYDDEWISTYENEILFTMQKTDQMLETLANFINHNKDYKLLITSSMGQEPVESEPLETQLYIVDDQKFFSSLGIGSSEHKNLPAMMPEFTYLVNDPKSFRKKLDTFKINGDSVNYRELGNGRFRITLGQENLKTTDIEIDRKVIPIEHSGLENVEIQDKSNTTAYHIPEGHFFVYHPSYEKSEISREQVSTQKIMPTILENFAVKVPDYAQKPNLSILR